MFTRRLKVLGRGVKRSGDRRLPGTGPRTSEMESALSLPHPHWSQRERKNSLKRAMPRPGGRKRRRQRTAPRGPFRPHSSAPRGSPPAAPAPAAAAKPLPAPPAPRLTQSVRSGETAAGAWERAAPAGVGLRRPVSPGTHGPSEPGTRKRREAEVGEGRRRAHALASSPAAAGSPFGRDRDRAYFQGGPKLAGLHPSAQSPAGLLHAPPAAAGAPGSARSAPHARLH